MTNLICFRHPDYTGASSPTLSCKTCCGMFLTELKRREAELGKTDVDTDKWLDEKAKQAQEAPKKKPAKYGFNPQSI